MNRYFKYGLTGFECGVISYTAKLFWLYYIPLVRWIFIAPTLLAGYISSLLGLPFCEHNYGLWGLNIPDLLFVSLFTACLGLVAALVAPIFKTAKLIFFG